jgi:hypothetical protein
MAKKKMQRRWKVGQEYRVEGYGTRRLKLFGRAKIEGREVLLMRPVRKARKRRTGKKR